MCLNPSYTVATKLYAAAEQIKVWKIVRVFYSASGSGSCKKPNHKKIELVSPTASPRIDWTPGVHNSTAQHARGAQAYSSTQVEEGIHVFLSKSGARAYAKHYQLTGVSYVIVPLYANPFDLIAAGYSNGHSSPSAVFQQVEFRKGDYAEALKTALFANEGAAKRKRKSAKKK